VDTVNPTSTYVSATYNNETNTLVIRGTNFTTANSVDLTKLTWDINANNAGPDYAFSATSGTATITDATTITINLTNDAAAGLEGMSGFVGSVADGLDVAAAFTVDTAGNTSAGTGANLVIALNLTGTDNDDNLFGAGGADTINGGVGDDALTGGTGEDTFVFADSAANNGSDTFADLTNGAGGDVLNLSAFNIDGDGVPSAGNLGAVNSIDPAIGVNINGFVSRLVNIAGNEDITTAAGLTAAVAANGEYANIDMDNSTKAIVITSATDGANDVDFIFYLTSDNAGVITATLVGTTINVVDIDSYVTGNFII
jgi:hypothetical protein